jgi:hypothetical protein
MSVQTDTALWHCAHQRRCLELNRCVCGHDRRRDEDFDAQLRRAMERYPEQVNPQEQSMTKQLAPHQLRVIDEKAELDARIEKLSTFIGDIGSFGPVFQTLPDAERMRLYAQYRVMREYSDILGERIAAFGA